MTDDELRKWSADESSALHLHAAPRVRRHLPSVHSLFARPFDGHGQRFGDAGQAREETRE